MRVAGWRVKRACYPATPSLAFDRASGEPSQDLALEDEDEHHKGERHQYRSGKDVAPGQLELRVATEAGDGWLHSAGSRLRESEGIKVFIPGGDERQQT